jgi:molybdate/tungstate transport system substrate-binding protein
MMKQVSVVFLLAFFLWMAACQPPKQNQNNPSAQGEPTGELVIFHAGSMTVPINQIADSFTRSFPNVKVLTEAAGSRECARKITDLAKPCDIMVSSDYKVIDEMLVPDFATFNIAFAANEMVIAYMPDNKVAKMINDSNWIDLLLKPGLAFGRSDPNSDPCGYRTLMVMQLAEKYFNRPGIAKKLAAKDTRYIRPKEVDLLALLESNSIDFVFIYKSVACQHKLSYLKLQAEMNLADPSKNWLYQQAEVKVNGNKPGSFTSIKGEAMIYGVTMLKNAPNPKAALAFMKFFLEKEKGAKIMEVNGQPSLIPYASASYDSIPEELKLFAIPIKTK